MLCVDCSVEKAGIALAYRQEVERALPEGFTLAGGDILVDADHEVSELDQARVVGAISTTRIFRLVARLGEYDPRRVRLPRDLIEN